MPIEQKFKYITPPGQTYILLDDWVAKTLSAEEQAEFLEARKRQRQFRQEAIDDGRLIVKDTPDGMGAYVWRDEAAFAQNKPHDPIWLKYHALWEQETGIRFSDEKTKT